MCPCWTRLDTGGQKRTLTCAHVGLEHDSNWPEGDVARHEVPYDPMHERCKIAAPSVRPADAHALGTLAGALHGPARSPLRTRGPDHHSAPHFRIEHVRHGGRRGLAPRRGAAPECRRVSLGHPRRGRASTGRARHRCHLRRVLRDLAQDPSNQERPLAGVHPTWLPDLARQVPPSDPRRPPP